MISNALTKFLSNKINLILMMCFGYVLLLIVLNEYNISLSQIILIFIIISVLQFIAHIIGVSKGMMFATAYKKELNQFMKIIKREEKKIKRKKND